MATAFPLDILRLPSILCIGIVYLCLAELRGMSSRMVDRLFGHQLCLSEVTLDILRLPSILCIGNVYLCLAELRRTSSQMVDCLFGSQLCLSKVTFVLGVPYCALMTLTDLVIH